MFNRRKILFIHEFTAHGDRIKAAKNAGYKGNPKNVAARLMCDPDVAREISRLTAERLERLDISAVDVLREIARVGMVDVGDAFDRETGRLMPLHEMSPDVRRVISSVKITTHRVAGSPKDAPEYAEVTEVKFVDKLGALSLLANHHGLTKPATGARDKGEVAKQIKAGRERASGAPPLPGEVKDAPQPQPPSKTVN